MVTNQINPTNNNILLVDDAQVNLRMLSRILKEEGYQVRTASDGASALEDIEASLPNLILLDILMPNMDGYEVCQQLKSQIHTKDIPIIFISSLDQTEDKLKAFALGGVDYVTKPFQTPEVLARVKAHLTLNHLQKQLEIVNTVLEDRVQKRTLSLTQTNEKLQDEIQERRQIEADLRQSKERYKLAVQGTNDGIWDWDLLQDKIYYSTRWKSILGYKEMDFENSLEDWFNHVHENDIARLRLSILNHVENITPFLEEEYRMYHKDGSYRYVLTRGVAVRDEDGKAYRMAGSQTDISYRKRIEEQLQHDVFYDSLTALPNRSLFFERLKTALAINEKRDDYHFAVYLLDVNRFKTINDTFGFRLGDLLLAEVSWRLKSFIRPVDTVARIGEDEFAILFESIENLEMVETLANTITQAFALPFDLEGNEVFISLSIGIALSTVHPKNLPLSSTSGGKDMLYEKYSLADEILRDASIALQRSKVAGESLYEIFRPTIHRRQIIKVDLEADLRQALESEDQFEANYQPIVSLETGRISGFEALTRWHHPVRGKIYPIDFIPMAEATGLIIPLDRLIIRKACEQTSKWQNKFRTSPPLILNVNISGRYLRQLALNDYIQQMHTDSGIDISSIHLDITETFLVENLHFATQELSKLRQLGVKIWMDDFGTGYSSLNYLHRLAIDGIKIDCSFIEQLAINPNSHKIVQMMIIHAREMNISVIAEGIEDDKVLNMLRNLQCRFGQGFIFSRAKPAEEAENLLTNDIQQNGLYSPPGGRKP